MKCNTILIPHIVKTPSNAVENALHSMIELALVGFVVQHAGEQAALGPHTLVSRWAVTCTLSSCGVRG